MSKPSVSLAEAFAAEFSSSFSELNTFRSFNGLASIVQRAIIVYTKIKNFVS